MTPRAPRRRRRWGRLLFGTLGAIVAAFVALVVGVGWFLSAPCYKGSPSGHFDGVRFLNKVDVPHGGFFAFLRWQLDRRRGPWQMRNTPPGPPPPRAVTGGALRVTFVNHATVLVQMDGVNVLTDPIWSERASPVSRIGPRRHHPPGIRFQDLPPIHAVVISHSHYDHLDLPTLRRLREAHDPRFFTGVGTGALLRKAGIERVEELDWWDRARLPGEVEVHGVPAQHFSNRGLFDRDCTLWVGFVVRGPAGTVYFAGDTGDGPHFEEVRTRLGAPRLALLPIGAYEPRWFMKAVHISPEEAVAAHNRLGAGTSVGIHHGTFALADEGQDAPAVALQAAAGAAGARFWVLGIGEGRDVPPGP